MTGKTIPGSPAPFENTYLRERALKIASRQENGQILVSGAKPESGQGLPLPYIHDVPGLQRSRYPYDYECEWGRFKYEYELNAYLFTPHNGQFPPGWAAYDLSIPLQPVTAKLDRARRLAMVRTLDQEIVLREVPIAESPDGILQQVNAVFALNCQPYVAWRLEWIDSEVNQLWPDGVQQIRNEHGLAHVTGFAHDEAGNLIYLGMVGHKTVLDSMRATVQSRQRKKLFLQNRPVALLPSHYSQAWQSLPDYGAHHAALIADPALPGKWLTGEELIYLLVFEDQRLDESTPESQACEHLVPRLAEALPIPLLAEWAGALWKAGLHGELIGELVTGGDCLAGYWVQVSETNWVNILRPMLEKRQIVIPTS